MNEKKILLLGGSRQQLVAIEQAKKKGYHTILCDYLSDNPGQYIADQYFCVSTTDKDAIASIAEQEMISGIMAYASDPAAPTAAYVAEKLGLPGNSYSSVLQLSEKHLFRKLMIENGFPCPQMLTYDETEALTLSSVPLRYPIVVKPVDSSGSKGVRVVRDEQGLNAAIKNAINNSRSKRIIMEQFVDASHGDIHGDGFFKDGKLVFHALGDHIYDEEVNALNPSGTIWPSVADPKKIEEIARQVEAIAQCAGYLNGPVNIEARIASNGQVYIMEIGPRNGGHFVPQAILHATGVDLLDLAIELSMGHNGKKIHSKESKPSAYYAIHSRISGILKSIEFTGHISKFIKESNIYKNIGDDVVPFTGSNAAIGVILFTFPEATSHEQVLKMIENEIKIHVSNE